MQKTVLITGCSSGFGKATAKFFNAKGWNVIATMRDPEKGNDLAALNKVLVTQLDVQDDDSIGRAVAAGIARFGRIDALVNNAGFGLFGLFEAASEDKIREQFEVNVFGVMKTIRAILPHFRANKAGVIANVSSGAGIFALPTASLYCASKFALEGFSEGIAYELASQGIAVKIVEPGGVLDTGFGNRSSSESAQSAVLDGYEEFLAGAAEAFAPLYAAATASSQDVAGVIFDAVTDGSDRLRYVATDDIKPLIAARQQTSEAEYIAYMRSKFLPKP